MGGKRVERRRRGEGEERMGCRGGVQRRKGWKKMGWKGGGWVSRRRRDREGVVPWKPVDEALWVRRLGIKRR